MPVTQLVSLIPWALRRVVQPLSGSIRVFRLIAAPSSPHATALWPRNSSLGPTPDYFRFGFGCERSADEDRHSRTKHTAISQPAAQISSDGSGYVPRAVLVYGAIWAAAEQSTQFQGREMRLT